MGERLVMTDERYQINPLGKNMNAITLHEITDNKDDNFSLLVDSEETAQSVIKELHKKDKIIHEQKELILSFKNKTIQCETLKRKYNTLLKETYSDWILNLIDDYEKQLEMKGRLTSTLAVKGMVMEEMFDELGEELDKLIRLYSYRATNTREKNISDIYTTFTDDLKKIKDGFY